MVLELQVPEEELFRRLAGRGRADDTPEVIRQRLVAYRKQTEPLLEYYGRRGLLKSIDGLGTVDEIFDRAKAVLDGIERVGRVALACRKLTLACVHDLPTECPDPQSRRQEPQVWKSYARREKWPRCARPDCWSGRRTNWRRRCSGRA